MRIGGSTSQYSSTYQSSQRVAGVGLLCFLAIRKFESYRRFLTKNVYKKGDQRTLFPHYAMLGDPG